MTAPWQSFSPPSDTGRQVASEQQGAEDCQHRRHMRCPNPTTFHSDSPWIKVQHVHSPSCIRHHDTLAEDPNSASSEHLIKPCPEHHPLSYKRTTQPGQWQFSLTRLSAVMSECVGSRSLSINPAFLISSICVSQLYSDLWGDKNLE